VERLFANILNFSINFIYFWKIGKKEKKGSKKPQNIKHTTQTTM
jgi:hypothetical protein